MSWKYKSSGPVLKHLNHQVWWWGQTMSISVESRWCDTQPALGSMELRDWPFFFFFCLFSKSEWTLRDVVCTYHTQLGGGLTQPPAQSRPPCCKSTSALTFPRGRNDLLVNDTVCAISSHQLLSPVWTACSEFLFKMQQCPWIMARWFTCSWWIF